MGPIGGLVGEDKKRQGIWVPAYVFDQLLSAIAEKQPAQFRMFKISEKEVASRAACASHLRLVAFPCITV